MNGTSDSSIVNLRLARKRRARAAESERADANRVLHGVAKADRTVAQANRDRVDRVLAGNKRVDGASAEVDAQSDHSDASTDRSRGI